MSPTPLMCALSENDSNGFRCLAGDFAMTLVLAPKQGDLLRTTVGYREGRVGADSMYAVGNQECPGLFPDGIFADMSPKWSAIHAADDRGSRDGDAED